MVLHLVLESGQKLIAKDCSSVVACIYVPQVSHYLKGELVMVIALELCVKILLQNGYQHTYFLKFLFTEYTHHLMTS